MAKFDSDCEDDEFELNFPEIKDAIQIYSKKKLVCLAQIVIDVLKSLHTEKDRLMNDFTSHKLDHKKLEQ